MSEFKNFRITLHLTHFFQDHRSLCKIFISKGMKNISDLENHVQEIFKIKDFYFISHGHYIPPSEDIRILHPDDIIIAIPILCNSMAVCATSTPMVNTKSNSLLKQKHKRQYIHDSKDISSCDEYSNMHIKKKKKKKNKPDPNMVFENEQDRLYSNKEEDIQEHNMKIDIKNSNEKEYRTKSKIDIVENENTEKNSTKQEVSSELPNSIINDICQNECNGSVKTKVLYFEKHSFTDESVDKKKLPCKRINIDYNEIEHEAKKTDLSLEENDKQVNNFDYIKDKKLFIRKRKSDLICYDLPKKSNVVKSILISNNSNININTSYVHKHNTPKNDENLLQEKYPLNRNVDKSVQNCENILQNPEKSSYGLNNCNDERQQIKINDNSITGPILESNETKITEVTSGSNHLFKAMSSLIDESQNSNLNGSNISKETELRDSASIKDVNIIEENVENESAFIEKYMDNNIMMNVKQPEQSSLNDSVFNLDIPFLANESSQKNANISSDILIDDNCSSSTAYDNSKCDTVSFITKRKRKRSHRKKKSKLSVDNSPISTTSSICNKHVSHFNTVHIKFNDDGEPINFNEKQENTEGWSEKVTSKVIDDPIDITVQTPAQDAIVKVERSLDENRFLTNDSINHITINDSIELDDIASTSGNILSEDVILKSPIMTSTKPKTGDLIAFKMLRLTENYTPAVSKHIVGEILSYNEITTSVDLKIIDGLDQCAEPGGKFSIGNSDKESYNMKSYCWTSLIEPRLIFP